jgi:hypothetical protein
LRSTNRSTIFFVSALVAGALTIILLLLFTGDDDSTAPSVNITRTPGGVATDSSSPSAEPTTEPLRFATESSFNREGSYSFSHPPNWDVVTDGSVSTVTSPNSDVVITIGFAAGGDLAGAATDLSELVRNTYQVRQMGPPKRVSIGGANALVFKGRADNDESTTIAFEVTAVEGSKDENFALSVFSYPDLKPHLRDVIEEIVGSFAVGRAS